MTTNLHATLVDIHDGLRRQPARTGLSFLAIVVGIVALTVLMAVLGGLEERSKQIVRELGINVFGITQSDKEARPGTGRRLADSHVALLRSNLVGCVVSGTRIYEVPVHGFGTRVRVVATDDALCRLRQWEMLAGRFLDSRDMQTGARVAVLTAALARQTDLTPGAVLTLGGIPYHVAGIVAASSGAVDLQATDTALVSGEHVAFVPSTTTPYWKVYGHPTPFLDAVFVRVPESTTVTAAAEAARALLAQPDQNVTELSWITPESLLRHVRRLQNTITLTVGSIAGLCLILGGTTLMSLMVANVRERVTEIGLRRSIGATTGDIAGLFMWEGGLVAGTAAVTGTLTTNLMLALLRTRLPIPVHISASTFAVPIVIALALGIAFSYWPARAAARISPSDALRNE